MFPKIQSAFDSWPRNQGVEWKVLKPLNTHITYLHSYEKKIQDEESKNSYKSKILDIQSYFGNSVDII